LQRKGNPNQAKENNLPLAAVSYEGIGWAFVKPNQGTTVHTGDTLSGQVDTWLNLGTLKGGRRHLVVVVNGQQVATIDGTAHPCETDADKHMTTGFTYTVPAEPPPVIKAVATVTYEDAHNFVSSLSWPTVDSYEGTWKLDRDVMTNDRTGAVHQVIDFQVHFSVQPDGAGGLTGTAKASYTEHYTLASDSCAADWTEGPLEWMTALSGTIKTGAGGAVVLQFTPATKQGPSFTRNTTCSPGTAKTPTWPGGGGTPINGVYDKVTDFPMTANLKGHQTISVHIRRVGS
jgi:hypothetical protein